MRISLIILVFFLSFAGHSAMAQTQWAKDKAIYLCDTVLNQKSYDYKNNFSPDFIKAIPEEYFQSLISEIIGAVGTCNRVEEVFVSGNKAKYKFISQSSRYVAFELSLDGNSLIDGFLIKDIVFPDVVIDSWNAAKSYASSWDGNSSISIENFSKGSGAEKDGSAVQPLGSGFKLYVLGAVADLVKTGSLKWDQTFPIRADWKSLPSGVMQDWADEKLVPLKTYVEYMIKISDNTATDHLINIAGRNTVESQLAVMGNSFEQLNRPFLTTAEMFKIKWASQIDIINSFINGDGTIRRSLLQNEIAAIPLSKVGTNGVSMEAPAFIREIEWFGSTNDLCESMKSLKEKNSPEVLDALSKNVPLLDLGTNSQWSYGGYKGGSEPGVLTMTYLVQNKNSEWGCVSLSWHNENQNVNQWIFFDFASKILKLAESYF